MKWSKTDHHDAILFFQNIVQKAGRHEKTHEIIKKSENNTQEQRR